MITSKNHPSKLIDFENSIPMKKNVIIHKMEGNIKIVGHF
jgi:hypothetical protein